LKSIYKNLNEEDYNNRNEINNQFSNSLLASMFMQNIKESDEVVDYLAIPQIHFNDCPLEWWKQIKGGFQSYQALQKNIYAFLLHQHPVKGYLVMQVI